MRFRLFVALIVAAVMTAAGQKPATLSLQYDLSRFRGYDGSVYTEVYYSFDVTSLAYAPSGGTFKGEAVASVWFKRSSDDSIAARQAWRIPFSVPDQAMLKESRSYTDLAGFLLTPDLYRMYIVVYDLNAPSVRDSVSVLVDVQAVPGGRTSLSDVELATSIVPAERDSSNRFYKNTFEVRPNPAKLFGQHQPVLFYYLEAYNLSAGTSPTYLTRAVVTNAVGKEVVNHEKAKRRANESNVEVGFVKVNALRSGSYTFTYSIIDSAANLRISSSKRFFIYNPSLPVDTLVNPAGNTVDATEYATMSEEELDREFEQSRYVASANELERYRKLKGVDGKRKALFEFWSMRDEDKATPLNETKQEYFRRVTYSNQQYRAGSRDGWRTDRGRVYVLYGQPDEVERHANEIDTKPYEIWYYNSIQGGVIFVFGDRTGFSDYVLLHSTHRNELRDDNWLRQVQSN